MNKTHFRKLTSTFILTFALLLLGSTTAFAQVAEIGAISETVHEIDAIAITIIIPPVPDVTQPTPPPTPRRVFPVSASEGYNYEGVREVVRIYELSPDECPEWINTTSFARNGYYYQLAEITRQTSVLHTVREHSEVIEIASHTNDLASIIAGLEPTIDFICPDGYTGVLHLDIRSIQMSRDGTRTASRTVTQVREYPNMSSADMSFIPQAITAGGRTYTLADVRWEAATTTIIDSVSIPTTFTAIATYERTATSTVSTGYTASVAYSGTLTRIGAGDTHFVVTFIGTPLLGVTASIPAQSESLDDCCEDTAELDTKMDLEVVATFYPTVPSIEEPTKPTSYYHDPSPVYEVAQSQSVVTENSTSSGLTAFFVILSVSIFIAIVILFMLRLWRKRKPKNDFREDDDD